MIVLWIILIIAMALCTVYIVNALNGIRFEIRAIRGRNGIQGELIGIREQLSKKKRKK